MNKNYAKIFCIILKFHCFSPFKNAKIFTYYKAVYVYTEKTIKNWKQNKIFDKPKVVTHISFSQWSRLWWHYLKLTQYPFWTNQSSFSLLFFSIAFITIWYSFFPSLPPSLPSLSSVNLLIHILSHLLNISYTWN